MNIFIAGLGLIGGSLARAISERTSHTVFGWNRSRSVCEEALSCGAIKKIAEPCDISECDIVIMGLYPRATIDFVKENIRHFKKGAILVDTCGIKTEVCEELDKITEGSDITFIGGHPMAGTQYSGIKHARATLFKNAPMVLVPPVFDDIALLDKIKQLLAPAGFGRFSVTTAERHDEMIAFTSQLAHVVSNAYVKTPTAQNHKGFSAGSYKDMTRVAWLNENMWTELFLENREPLLFELNSIINSLSEYRDAIEKCDADRLRGLLKDGREAKERVDG